MPKKYRVTLTAAEREQLTEMVSKGKAAARALTHARILLKVDEAGDGPAWIDTAVCSEAPAGRARWSLRLLADRFVELGHVEEISHETIRQTLKKTRQSLG